MSKECPQPSDAQLIIDQAKSDCGQMISTKYTMDLTALLYERHLLQNDLRSKEEEIRLLTEEIYNRFPSPIPEPVPFPPFMDKEDN